MNRDAVIESFVCACDDLAELVNQQLFDGLADWDWIGVGMGVVGGCCDFNGEYMLTPDEMFVIVMSGITFKEFSEWWDWNLYHAYLAINLTSWLRGLRNYSEKELLELLTKSRK